MRTRTLSQIAPLALLAALFAAPAMAQTAPSGAAPDPAVEVPPAAVEVPESVRLLVDAIDVPLTPQNVALVGLTETQAVALAVDVEQKRYTRIRAVGALAILGGDRARQVVELLATADPDAQVRAQAVVSLARVWGPDDREAVVEFLVERLTDAPEPVADAIIRELARLYR